MTGWAIRCTILRNSPKQHLRRSLITLSAPRTESPWKDAEKLREIAWEKVMTRPRHDSTLERGDDNDGDDRASSKLLYTIQILLRTET